MKKLILIDANAIIHRAFHALPALKSPSRLITNAIFGFSSTLLKMIKDLQPDFIIAAYDLPKPTFRHKAFEEYKIHRAKTPEELVIQIPYTKKILESFGIPYLEIEGYEADDIIGSLAEKFKKEGGLQIIIVTGDLDTLQLVDDKKVIVYTMKKGLTDTIIYDQDMVLKRFGLEPEQLADFKGLKGDPSDNIPGVKGIGEKTASELLKKFNNLENLYKKIRPKKKKSKTEEVLLKYEREAMFSKELARIIKNLNLDINLKDADWKRNYNQSKLENIFRELGFSSLIPRIQNLVEGKNQEIEEKIEEEKIKEKLISNQNALGKLKNKIIKNGKFAFDFFERNLGVAINKKEIYFIKQELIFSLKDIFENKEILKIGQEIKKFIKNFKFKIELPIFDIQIASWLLNSDLKEPSLKEIYFSEFNKLLNERYSVLSIFRLYEVLWEKIKENNLVKVFEELEMPLIPVLAEIENNGVKIDRKELGEIDRFIEKEIKKLENEIYEFAGIKFNINSSQQLADILFNRLKISGKIRKTPGGKLSTSASELEKIRESHPIIQLILNYRELQKLKTTYINPFPKFINQEDGRLHTNYIQTGTVTGRLASQNPNLQNIPIKTELGQKFRKAFIAEDGYNLVSLDYSQLELRIIAHIAKDEKMIKAFRQGEDIHLKTASEVFDVLPENVTPRMRRRAKALNFGIIYGMGPLGFARSSGISQKEAKEFIEKYFQEFPKIFEYINKIKIEAHNNEVVKTLFGRRRILNEINSSIPELVRQAERMAINFPIQGTGADLMKIAMIKIYNHIHKNYKNGDGKIILQIHDEIVLEIKEEICEKLLKELKEIMENVYRLDVPLEVEVKIGKNWAEMEKIL